MAAVVVVCVASHANAADGTYVADPAYAVEDPIYVPELRTPVRFAIGIDFGIGVFGGLCELCQRPLGGVSVDVFAGVQVSHRVAILADLWTVAHLLPADEETRGFITHNLATVATRVWVTPEFWLSGGLGTGILGATQSGKDSYDFAPAVLLSTGGEIKHRPDRGIDVSMKLGGGLYDDDGGRTLMWSAAAVLGWHWY